MIRNGIFPYDELLLRCRMFLFHNPERRFCDAKATGFKAVCDR